MQRPALSDNFPLGSKLPQFSLKNIDGREVDPNYFLGSKAALVVFSCNHCPYVKGSEEMLIKIVKHFDPLGLKTVSINSNDSSQYPEDSFEKMKDKAKRMSLPYPYLYDESQDVARLFDAACTPECYLFDVGLRLVYHGPINDSPGNPGAVKTDFLAPAISSVLAGQSPQTSFVHPIGCSIKWR